MNPRQLPEPRPDADPVTITINRHDFTPAAFLALLERRPGEPTEMLARRLASVLGVGCVITRKTGD